MKLLHDDHVFYDLGDFQVALPYLIAKHLDF